MYPIQKPKDFDDDAFVQQAKAIYRERYKETLEKTAKGKVAAIEIESGDCFIGEDIRDAYYKAKQKHFTKFFFFINIGIPKIKKRRR